MKKIACIALIGLAAIIISWGAVGYRTVALIADNHLTRNQKPLLLPC
ncbi:hypothetical protein ACFQ3S_17305 [Mucilaginibacter terrae]